MFVKNEFNWFKARYVIIICHYCIIQLLRSTVSSGYQNRETKGKNCQFRGGTVFFHSVKARVSSRDTSEKKCGSCTRDFQNIVCHHLKIATLIKLKREIVDNVKKSVSGETTTPKGLYLKWMCLRNRRSSVPDLKVEFENVCCVEISARTVQRQLTECSHHDYSINKKPVFKKNTQK